jgi:hypothetical protein
VQTARQATGPADADAVRSAIEEFEAAVERAHRDSAAGTGDPGSPAADGTGETRTGAEAGSAGATDHDHPGRDIRRHENDLPEGAEQ